LGIFLLLVELAVFIGWPLLWELQQVARLRPYFKRTRRLFVSAVGVMIFMMWLFVPYPHTEQFPAVTVAVEDQVVYVPHDGSIEALFVQRGDRVEKGAPLAQLRSDFLDSEIAQTRKDIAIGKKEILILIENDEDRAFIPEKQAELAAHGAKLQGLLEMQKQMLLKATVSGQVYLWDEMLRVGQAVSVDQVFGKIAEPSKLEVLCFIPEVSLSDVHEGQEMRYLIRGTGEEIVGQVFQGSPSRATELLYPQLGSIYAGDLPVVEGEEGELFIVESYYPYRARLVRNGKHSLRIGQRGECELRGPARSRAGQFLRFAGSVLLRESGF